MKILLICSLGENIAGELLPYVGNGHVENVKMPTMLRKTFARMVERAMSVQIILFANSGRYNVTPEARENAKNI